MQTHTPSIHSLTPGVTPPNANRVGNGAVPDVAFNSILAREIERPTERSPARPVERTPERSPSAAPAPANPSASNRANENRAAENRAADKSGSAEPANAAPAPSQNTTQASSKEGKAEASDAASGNNGTSASSGTGGSNGTGGTSGTSASQTDPATEAKDALQEASDPTAALLALVASFNTAPQAASGKAAAKTEAGSDSVTASSSDAASVPLAVATARGRGPEAVVADASGFAQAISSETGETTDKAATLTATEPQTKALAAKPEAAQLAAEPKAVVNAPVQAAATEVGLAANPQALRAAGPHTSQAAQNSDALSATGPLAAASSANSVANSPALAKLQQTIAPRVGNPLWDQALGQHVVYMASNGQQSASLILNPAELGPVQVTLQINNDQASASFTALQPETRQALEAALPKLREMMSEAGIVLGNATVGTGLPNNQQPGQQPDQPRGHGNLAADGPGFGSDGEAAPRVLASRPIADKLGLVDTFV